MTGTETETDSMTRSTPEDRPTSTRADRIVFVIATLTLFGALVAALLRSITGDAP
ncbi:hypothetical protein ACFQ61_00595 [Streptomyces sp. NPDC056500]|uniref:hypothetical protein n=1 Tax=unclassified Streptomyces TaxID=2593676 RepID=UPI0033C013A1